MTLIIALKYANGVVLAADTRTMLGDLKRDKGPPKLVKLGNSIAIGSAGLTGACDHVMRELRATFSSSATLTFENVVSRLSDIALDYYKKNAEKAELDDDESNFPLFTAACHDRIISIRERGYTEEAHDYDCLGSQDYGEYILGNRYRSNLNQEEAKELAVHTILETSKVDTSVSDVVDLIVLPKGEKAKVIEREEIDDLKLRVIPLSSTLVEEQTNIALKIVELRAQINEIFLANFNFELFELNEKAIVQLMKPCRSETEFTASIATLGLLVDRIQVE